MASPALASSAPVSGWIDDLQAAGRYTFTSRDLVRTLRRSRAAIAAALRRLQEKGRVASPRRGFHVIVPPEYRTAGCPPATWFVADLMLFLRQPYYVGILSAAALHGAAHQQPMTFQVVTDRPTRPAQAGRVRVEFHMSGLVARTPTVELQTETGSIRVATPAATAFDLVRFAAAAGFLDNVATVLAELVEKIDPVALGRCARLQTMPDVQRLGYLLQNLDRENLSDRLYEAVAGRRRRPVLLAPGHRRGRARPEGDWVVMPNVTVEPDL